MFIPLGMLSPKITTFRFSNVKGSMWGSWWEVDFFKRDWECCCSFSCHVCCCNCYTDDLAAGITAAVVVVVAFVDVVFDYDYTVCDAVDVVAVAGYVVLFVVVAVDDASVPIAAYFDA